MKPETLSSHFKFETNQFTGELVIKENKVGEEKSQGFPFQDELPRDYALPKEDELPKDFALPKVDDIPATPRKKLEESELPMQDREEEMQKNISHPNNADDLDETFKPEQEHLFDREQEPNDLFKRKPTNDFLSPSPSNSSENKPPKLDFYDRPPRNSKPSYKPPNQNHQPPNNQPPNYRPPNKQPPNNRPNNHPSNNQPQNNATGRPPNNIKPIFPPFVPFPPMFDRPPMRPPQEARAITLSRQLHQELKALEYDYLQLKTKTNQPKDLVTISELEKQTQQMVFSSAQIYTTLTGRRPPSQFSKNVLPNAFGRAVQAIDTFIGQIKRTNLSLQRMVEVPSIDKQLLLMFALLNNQQETLRNMLRRPPIFA